MTTMTPVRSVISESALFDAYRQDPDVLALKQAGRKERRPCACRGVVEADPADPAPGVAAHQETRQHWRWREANDL